MIFKLKHLLHLLFVSFFFLSCDSDDDEAILPISDPVSDFVAIAQNQSVSLSWSLPESSLFENAELTFNDEVIEIGKTQTSYVVNNLTNGEEYTFELVAIDSHGTRSDVVSAKATPDKYVSVYEGRDAEDGSYYYEEFLHHKIVVAGNNLTYLMGNSSFYEWHWEGDVIERNPTSFIHEYEFYTDRPIFGRESIEFSVRKFSSEFCIDKDENTYYVRFAFMKISGEDGFLPGKYQRFSVFDYSKEDEEVRDSFIEIMEDGTGKHWTEHDGELVYDVTELTWNNEDLLNEEFFFVNYNGKVYLVTESYSDLYEKR